MYAIFLEGLQRSFASFIQAGQRQDVQQFVKCRSPPAVVLRLIHVYLEFWLVRRFTGLQELPGPSMPSAQSGRVNATRTFVLWRLITLATCSKTMHSVYPHICVL